jgi:hypothetical protein
MMSATARFRNHFLFDGIRYPGAVPVERRASISSNAAMYESQSFRSARSPTRNFHCLSGSSNRAWKRAFCSSGSM